jgi:hypothetical protein
VEPAALAEVYRCLCPPSNYFYPSVKITGKIRLENGRYKKIYDEPKTPCPPLLESPDISDEARAELKKRAAAYNPAYLKIAMDKARYRLLRITREKANYLNPYIFPRGLDFGSGKAGGKFFSRRN